MDPERDEELEAFAGAARGTPPGELPTVTVFSPGPLGPGTMLGPYRLESVLGQGGMGIVYRALDTKLKRTVAVKLLLETLSDATARRRFQREAQTVSSLNHPHILTVHDAGEMDGRQYIVTEFVDGGTMGDWARQEPRSWQEIIELIAGVADGLATAHEANILHRDIKPSNVLVSRSGYAKLADFGLAKTTGPEEADASTELTRIGAIAGTVAYMSPEQCSGQHVDARSDIFSFGVLLYELLAGRRPFAGASHAAMVTAIMHTPPEPLPDKVPAPLRHLVEKALEKKPADRFQSMRELVAGLRRLTRQDLRPAVRRRIWIAAGAAAACLVAAGAAWRLLPKPAPAVRSIAVLPFRNLSGDSNQEFLSDGTTEQLITNLASIRSLRVISRTSVMRYKNTSKGVAEIARELGVDALLEGSVQKSSSRVRVRASLIRAASDTTIWSQDYDRDVADALNLETLVARSIASAIRLDLTPAEITRLSGRPIKPAAIEPYLRARYYAFNLNNEDLKEATRLFEEVVRIQPDLAAAHAGIAGAWLTRMSFAGASVREVEEHARGEAKKAAELDPNSVDAHVSLGMLYTSLDRKWADAEREFLEAQRIAPNLPDSYNDYSYMLIIVGRLSEAIAQIERGLALDPLNPEMRLTYSLALFRARRYQDAEANYRLTLELDPKNVTAVGTRITLAEVSGNYAEALERLQKWASERGQDLSSSAVAARIYARMGRRADAERTFGNAMNAPDRVSRIQVAAYYAAIGKKQEAVQELQKSANKGQLSSLIKTDPLFDDLHSEPGFIAILKQARLLE